MKLLIAAIVLALSACVTPPDKPMSLDEQQLFQANNVLNQARFAKQIYDAYVAIEGPDWPEQKYNSYVAFGESAQRTIDKMQELIDLNDFSGIEAQQIILQALIDELTARAERDRAEANPG